MKIKAFTAVLLFSFVCLKGLASEIFVNTTNGYDFYHFALKLTGADIRLDHPEEYFDPNWPEATSGPCEFGENGFFIVYVSKKAFPLPAPNCNSQWIKVVMDGRSETREDVDSKNRIWEKIKAAKRRKQASVTVILELNPYFKMTSESPLKIEMTQCNAYFRTAWGAYIDHTGPLD